ncbi:hypothetical protein FisN_10Lh366 [Fistulifera solaris]|uniref:Uncharacterized protein n=1 Tax=Fistulifera solaris TaxID=1519565 RepID=A0A1Z5JUE9_FISSO|nr:hypothetical protein FisN_10Lh366 [Fistulifera solaris]|eukprot:GAX17663.1 hypothetical protein FisN_10Lh366 [Fistulifera solaris]
MQTLLIRQPECNNLFTFGWGDMPYQGEHDGGYYEDLSTAHPISTRMTMLPESFFRPQPASSSVQQQQHARKRCRRSIRFAEQVQVRTHETILGDHPLCYDGLALQCGWAYAATEYTPLSNSVEKKQVRRLDQMTRRQRLREVTGMSHVQLLQVANALLDSAAYQCWNR